MSRLVGWYDSLHWTQRAMIAVATGMVFGIVLSLVIIGVTVNYA